MAYTEAKSAYGGYAKFLGMRNEAQSRRQPKGDANTGEKLIALSASNNIDIDDEGGIVSRPGYISALAGTSITAAYSSRFYKIAYIVDNGSLKRILPNLDTTILGAVPTDDTYWVEVGNKVFLSTGHIVDGDNLIPWRVQPPQIPIVLTIGGSLSAGLYQIALTQISADGRESGSSVPIRIDVPANSGFELAGVAGCNVYVTAENGDIFYKAGYETTFILDTTPYNYPLDEVLLMAAALPDNVGPIAYYDSCLYYTLYDKPSHTTLIGWSNPFRWHTFDVFGDYFQVAGEVRLLVGLDEVLLIGTDKEILAYNGEKPNKLAKYGVPRGHNYSLTRDGKIFFQTVRGVCTMPFENLSGDKVALPAGDYCTTGLVDINGLEKFITLTDGNGVPDNSTIF